MIEAILDTNVFISGIFWSGPPYAILQAWKNHKIHLVYSAEILEEYIRVGEILEKKYKIEISAFIELITIYGKITTPSVLLGPITKDLDDDKFIACAIGANCPIIVSGDKHLLDVAGYSGINIIKPASFVKTNMT